MAQPDVSYHLFLLPGAEANPSIIAFHKQSASFAAHNFAMPALSPTMTEGNITKWNVKEGR